MSRPTSRSTRSFAAVPLAALLVAGGAAAPAAAAPKDRSATIPLVTGSMPEGISPGPGNTFFAGARSDGAVYVANTKNGKLRLLVPGSPGEVAVGLLYDEANKRLWVAGGTTGDVTAYDARSGRLLFTVNTGAGRFLNDVAITADAVYVTDSRNDELIVIPTAGGLRESPTFTALAVPGLPTLPPNAFGANGIRALPNGELLLVRAGVLYRVTTAGRATVVPVNGPALRGGDGLVLSGNTLYVVNGYGGNEVVVLELTSDFSAANTVGVLTDSALDRPTTAALVDGSLYVVNGRFGTIAGTPDAPVYVTRLPAR